jgi:hypothetical protein
MLSDGEHFKATFHSSQVGEAIICGFDIPPRFVNARRDGAVA